MKKIIPLLLLSLIILCPIIAESADATTLFLTSDNLHEHDADFARLNDIKERIESKTNGDIVVVVDDSASNPGEGTRVMAARCDVAVTIAGACAGNLVDLADYSTKVTKKVIYVNAGTLDLNTLNFLRRSYDDNWSHYTFASVQSPGKFLNDAGITLIQPAQRQLDTDLIVYHKLDPKYLAEDSKKIVDGHGSDMQESYGSYTTQQLLYMSASYIGGYALEVPGDFGAPDNPQKYSSFTKGEYSFNDYYNMADIVVDYMNEHGKAPDSINYEGATIGYYDLVYNFALLTEDDTSASKYYSDLLYEILPIGMIIVAIILILLIVRSIIRRIKRRIRRRKERKYRKRMQRERYGRNPRQFHRNIDSRYYSDYDYPSNKPKRLNRQERRRR